MNTTASQATNISLPEAFTLSTLSDLKTTLDCLMADNKEFTLDGSEVQRVDGAAAQFLLQCNEFHFAGTERLVLHNASEPLQQALSDLGLSYLLSAGAHSLADSTEELSTAKNPESGL